MYHQRCGYPQRDVPLESREDGLSHQQSIPSLGGAPQDQITGYTRCRGWLPQQQNVHFKVREIRGHHTGSRASFSLADMVLDKREVESEKSTGLFTWREWVVLQRTVFSFFIRLDWIHCFPFMLSGWGFRCKPGLVAREIHSISSATSELQGVCTACNLVTEPFPTASLHPGCVFLPNVSKGL